MKRLKAGASALGVLLSEAQVDRFRRYSDELLTWNRRVNLTAVTDPREIETRHFLESLAVCGVAPRAAQRGGRLADVGSGAGFPGLPLGIAFPDLRVTLIEAATKRAAFLQHVAGVLDTPNVSVRVGRAEELAHDPDLRGSFDLVVSRAVAPMRVLAELTLPFCAQGGMAVAHKGPGADDEVREAAGALSALGGDAGRVATVDVAGMERPVTLVVVIKVSPTPDRFPRRPGMPRKRPL